MKQSCHKTYLLHINFLLSETTKTPSKAYKSVELGWKPNQSCEMWDLGPTPRGPRTVSGLEMCITKVSALQMRPKDVV